MSLSRILSGNPDQSSRWQLLAVGLFVLLWFVAAMHEYVYFIKDTYFRPEPAHAQDIIDANRLAFTPDFYKSGVSLPEVFTKQLNISKVPTDVGGPVRPKVVGKR